MGVCLVSDINLEDRKRKALEEPCWSEEEVEMPKKSPVLEA